MTPAPGRWRLTTIVDVEDIGPIPPGLVAIRVDGRHRYAFPTDAGRWQAADTPTFDAVLDDRIYCWDRAARNAPRDSEEQTVARAIVDELTTIRALTSRGTTT